MDKPKKISNESCVSEVTTSSQGTSKRRTIIETVKEMPFTCLNCDEKVVKLRDLARLGCHCLRPFYHFHCLAALPVNLCMKCNKRAHTLRGIRAIWDSFTHDEWKSSFDLDLLRGVDRSYVIELMDSMLLWEDNNNLTGFDINMPPSSLNFLVCDFWKVFHILEDNELVDLVLDRLEDALRIYPLEDRVILGSKKGIRSIRKYPSIKNHYDFLRALGINSQGIVSSHLLNWIKEDLVRNQSIFFTGPLIFDILYGAFLKNKESRKLIIQILGLDDVIIRKLLAGLLDKITESFIYECSTDYAEDHLKPNINSSEITNEHMEVVNGRKCYINNLGQNRLKLTVEGLSQQIEIHLFRSNDIRKIMISSKAGSLPYEGDGLIASPSGLWTTLRWLYTSRERTIISEGNYKIPKNLLKSKDKCDNMKQIINIEAIKHGFLLCTDLSKLRREFADPYTDYEDLDDDIEEKFIPDSCMRITIDNLWDYMQKPTLIPGASQECYDLVEVECPFFPEEVDNSDNAENQEHGYDDGKNFKGHLYTTDHFQNAELVADLVRRVTYNKKNNILDSLPNPYMPPRR